MPYRNSKQSKRVHVSPPDGHVSTMSMETYVLLAICLARCFSSSQPGAGIVPGADRHVRSRTAGLVGREPCVVQPVVIDADANVGRPRLLVAHQTAPCRRRGQPAWIARHHRRCEDDMVSRRQRRKLSFWRDQLTLGTILSVEDMPKIGRLCSLVECDHRHGSELLQCDLFGANRKYCKDGPYALRNQQMRRTHA